MSWHNLAGEYGLPHRYASKKLEQHHVPTHCLPLSFHIELFKSSWRSADVYMDSIYQALGTTGFHVLRPMMLSLLALFHGRLIDNPVRRMAQETRNLVGEVTHEIFAMDDTIFIVLEVDMIAPQEQEHVARLFKLFISAAQDNHYSKSQVRIYGLLTDRVRFAFFSYDHSLRRFAFDEELLAGGPRGQYLTRLIPIANKIFNVLFSGYLALLQASAISKVTNEHSDTRLALQYATEAIRCFALGKSGDLSLRGEDALRMLQASTLAIPRDMSPHMEVPEPKTAQELEDLAFRSVREWHERNCLTPCSK